MGSGEQVGNEELQERYRAALAQIGDLTKTLIAVSTGTLALSATLLKNFGSDSYLPILYWAWVALAASTLFGIGAILEQIGKLSRKSIPNPVNDRTLQICNGAQLASLLLGLVLLGIFSVANLNNASGPDQSPEVVPISQTRMS